MSINQSSSLNKTAARWFIRMQDAAIDSPERTQFENWLMQSELHQAEYSSIAEAWRGIDSIDELKKMAAAKQAHQFLNQNKRSKKIKNAMAVLSVCFIFVLAGLFGHEQYQQWLTKPTMQMASESSSAQILTQKLEDGSEITLNASSKIQITYYRHQRHIALLQGEAIFNVTKDADRPFVVETDTAKVKVLGTRFAVNKLSQLVRVSVDHGSVQVESNEPASTLILHDGQVAEVAGGQLVKLKNSTAADYFKFASGTIVFNQADIFEIADVLSRYGQRKISAEGNSQEKISAVLNTKDIETFLGTLPKIANVEVQQMQESTLIQSIK
jgi:transmembrane sensor